MIKKYSNLTKKFYPVLSTLKNSRIFYISLVLDKTQAEFVEACDNYFHCLLSKKEMLTLAEEIKEIAEQMEE